MKLLDRLFGKRPTLEAAARSDETPPNGERSADPPPLCSGNPGQSVGGQVGFRSGDRSWTETFHVVRLAATALRGRGHVVVDHGRWLELPASRYVLQPRIAEIRPLDAGGVHTMTTIDIRQPELVPDGLFEYQHSTGDNINESVRKGFESWADVDFPVLLDARLARPETCTLWVMELPAGDGRPARTRRAILGGVSFYPERAPRTPPADSPADSAASCSGDDDFCPCCFLTRNAEAFRPLIEADGPAGIRFYAVRRADGTIGADCRINGEDFEQGIAALRSYAATWPGSGFAFRKQYVFLHTLTAQD